VKEIYKKADEQGIAELFTDAEGDEAPGAAAATEEQN
jgi:hypothetical protein